MAFKWKRELDDIARVVPKGRVSGFFTKSVILTPNEKAVMIRNGNVEDVIDSGKIRVGGLLKPGNIRKDVDVALIDTSEKELDWEQSELWTKDSQQIGCKGILKFRITDVERFFQMLFAYSTMDKHGERYLSLYDVYSHLQSEVLTRVLEPEIHKINIEEIYGNRELQIAIENELEMQLKDTLRNWGLEIERHTAEWDFAEYEKVRRTRNQFQTTEELEEIEALRKEGKFEREGREQVAEIRKDVAAGTALRGHERTEEEKEALHKKRLGQIEIESDAVEARSGIGIYKEWKDVKTEAKRGELELEEDMKDRQHGRDMEYLNNITSSGGEDVAKIVAQGRELSSMTPEQLEALAKIDEAKRRAEEDRVGFMMDVEDREREDSYRRKELDADIMAASRDRRTSTVKKCPGCGTTLPAEASFCGQCGMKLDR